MRLGEKFIKDHLCPAGHQCRMVLSTLGKLKILLNVNYFTYWFFMLMGDSAKFYEKIGYEPCYPMTKTKHSPKSDIYFRQSNLVVQEKVTVTKYKGQDQFWLHKIL